MSHVAFVIPGLDRIGGAESQILLLAKGLRERGWRVSVVALSGAGGKAALDLQKAQVEFLSLGMRKGLADPRGWVRMHRWLKSRRPDVVHAHLPHAAWFARWSRLAAPVRVVVDTLHSSSTGTTGRHVGYRMSDWLTDRVTAVSEAVAQSHLDARMAKTVQVIPNGIDVHVWRPDPAVRASTRRELEAGIDFLWIAAGRLEPVKDYRTLLNAMAHLPESARLIIAGDGALREQLLKQSRELGLQKRVRFLGFQQDVRRWMQAADGYVLTSRWEGLPIALLEAQACGLSAVATDVPGTRGSVVADKTGWLVPPGDPTALAEAMGRLMRTSGNELREARDLARQHVVDCFSLGSVLDRWEALYSDLMQQNRIPRRWKLAR